MLGSPVGGRCDFNSRSVSFRAFESPRLAESWARVSFDEPDKFRWRDELLGTTGSTGFCFWWCGGIGGGTLERVKLVD